MSRESDKRVVGESDTLKPQSGFLMLQNLPSACNYPCNPWNLSHESRSRCEQKRRCEVRMNQRKQNILPEYNEEVNDLIQKFIAKESESISYVDQQKTHSSSTGGGVKRRVTHVYEEDPFVESVFKRKPKRSMNSSLYPEVPQVYEVLDVPEDDKHVRSKIGAMYLIVCKCVDRESSNVPLFRFRMLHQIPSIRGESPCDQANLSGKPRFKCLRKPCELPMFQWEEDIQPEYHKAVDDLVREYLADGSDFGNVDPIEIMSSIGGGERKFISACKGDPLVESDFKTKSSRQPISTPPNVQDASVVHPTSDGAIASSETARESSEATEPLEKTEPSGEKAATGHFYSLAVVVPFAILCFFCFCC